VGEDSEKGWFGVVETKCKSIFLREGDLHSFRVCKNGFHD